MPTPVTPGGVKLNLAGREIVLPALSLRHVRDVHQTGLITTLAGLGRGLPTPEQVDAIVDLMLLALSRSEATKEIGKEELLDRIDAGNIEEVFNAICQGSGLVKVAPGEAAGPKS